LLVRGSSTEIGQVRDLVKAQKSAGRAREALQDMPEPVNSGSADVMPVESEGGRKEKPKEILKSTARNESPSRAIAAAPVPMNRMASPDKMAAPVDKAAPEKPRDFWVNASSQRLPVREITAKYRLSGIAKLGPATRIAFIDGKEYEVGTSLDGMRIVEISSSDVRLEKETPKGIQTYLLGFPPR
jgi:hypothetical protein